MNTTRILVNSFFILLLFTFRTNAQDAGKVTIIDAQHYSNIFGETRNYRIFLPPGYADNPGKKYPVIYFMHGWSQRYFGSVNPYADFDKGDENKGDNIANFVDGHQVIVVKSDGYDRSPDEAYYVRPYNIGPVETFRQFPIYYPELVNYIDTHYRTIADREHRAISGLSMGGFMAFWIGGKYPDLFSAAGNFCGSPEFVVGPKDMPVEYRHIDMYKNYGGMKLRLNYGDKDFIRGYHQDMDRLWPRLMNNYESKIYNAEHSTCGLGDMFSFLLKTFENPPPKPDRWDHIDVYPQFSVWDYTVSSDRIVPGFTIMEDVDKRGFKCSVRESLPDGDLFPFVHLSITTAALYEKNQLYVINDIDTKTLKASRQTIRSDNSGRLCISINGSSHEIGINKNTGKPNLAVASVEIQNMHWATHNKDVQLKVDLLNKGASTAKNITVTLWATKNGVNIIQSISRFGNIAVNEIHSPTIPFIFRVTSDSIEIEKFKLVIRYDEKNEWVAFFEIPVKKDVPEIKNFEIADGKMYKVVKAATDSETVLLGAGNGDGVANPGESIVLLVKDQDKYWRTHLSFKDRYINPFGITNRKSDHWDTFDYVGASAKYDIPLVSSECPEGHEVDFFAEYWLPEYPLHIIKQGLIKIVIKGKDETPPKLTWVNVPGDNVIQAKLSDGSKIQSVKARFILKKDSTKTFGVELKDDGTDGDKTAGDNVFSRKIPGKNFGFYRVIIESLDSFDNKLTEEVAGEIILH